jgi:hypothetical protein
VSRPLTIPSIPLRGVHPSPRHIHTTSPSHLPNTLKHQIKVVHPEPRTKDKRRGTNPIKKTWKERIGAVRSRIYSRLAQEDKVWKVLLKEENQGKWKRYVEKVHRAKESLPEDFGKPSRWLASEPEPPVIRPPEHQRILDLWKSGRKSLDEEPVDNRPATKPAKKVAGLNLREENKSRELEEQQRASKSKVQPTRSGEFEQRREPEFFWDQLKDKKVDEEAQLQSKAAKAKAIKVFNSGKLQR